MLDPALVNNYVKGQMGRRAFVRTLVRSGISLSAALAYAGSLGAAPALADCALPNERGDGYNEDQLVRVSLSNGIDPRIVTVKRGGLVQWNFAGHALPGEAGYSNRKYLFSDPLDFIDCIGELSYGRRAFTFYAAGTFPYVVKIWSRQGGGEYLGPVIRRGEVRALIRVSKATMERDETSLVSWATRMAPDGWTYDAQIKGPNDESFVNWKVETTDKDKVFNPARRGTYRFRAHIRRISDNEVSGWSPVRSIVVG